VFDEFAARGDAAPVVFDSPHSGFDWPDEFRPVAPIEAVRTTWDAHVDRLIAGAPALGVTVLSARFPRAFIDVNRDVRDIDPALLAAPWPEPLAPTDYSRRGMGLVRRLALPGVKMYDAPLETAVVRARIDEWYLPYRARLAALIDDAHATFGAVWHIDWHSMKPAGNAMNVDAGATRPDIVVSDGRGLTAQATLTARIVEWFAAHGYVTQANDPYQGGDLVRTYGAPARGRSSVQVEINRALYMDEATTEPHDGFASLQSDITDFTATLARWAREERRAQ
jgi:N-formylglutamate deformylase